MNKPKHTPSWERIPWDGEMEIRDSETKENICILGNRADGAIPNAETQANARLIAAAPDLLEALTVLSYANSDDPDDYPDRQLFEIVQDAVKKAKAAIEEATK